MACEQHMEQLICQNIYLELSFGEIMSYIPSFWILLERINSLLHFLLSEIYSKIEYRNYKIKGRSSLGILIKKYSGIKTLLQNIFVASIIRYIKSLSLNILCIYIFPISEYKTKSQYSASVTKVAAGSDNNKSVKFLTVFCCQLL